MKKEVLAHYEDIGDDFTDLSNKYCNGRYERYLKRLIKPAHAVLEVGCGTGLLLSKQKASQRIGIDLSPRLLSQLSKRSREGLPKGSDPEGMLLLQADAENLPFKDSSFDIVYSVNLLEHLPHPEQCLRESMRVLKKGGRLVAITPNGDWDLLLEIADRLKLKAPEGPHRFITSSRFKRMIALLNREYAGLAVENMRKFAIAPSGPRFILDSFESLERLFPQMGFFHLLIIRK